MLGIKDQSAIALEGAPGWPGGLSWGYSELRKRRAFASLPDMSEDLAQARADYLAKHRKARDTRKAKRDQKTARQSRYKPKQSPPPLPAEEQPRRDWPDIEKAQWCERMIEYVANGGSVSSFVRLNPQGPVRSQFYRWLEGDASMWDKYARAREMSADTLADDCVSIADSVRDAGQFDSARVNAARLAVDARKWVASKLKPKTYADRLETVTSGSVTVEHRISDEDRAKVLQALEARRLAANAPNLIEAQRLIDVTPTGKDGPSR